METLIQIGLVMGLGAAFVTAAERKSSPDALHFALAAAFVYSAYVAHRRGRLLVRVENEVLLPMLAECELRGQVPPGTYASVTGRPLPGLSCAC